MLSIEERVARQLLLVLIPQHLILHFFHTALSSQSTMADQMDVLGISACRDCVCCWI